MAEFEIEPDLVSVARVHCVCLRHLVFAMRAARLRCRLRPLVRGRYLHVVPTFWSVRVYIVCLGVKVNLKL